MSKTDGDPLGPDLVRRLRAELDRVQPRSGTPRYASASIPLVAGWRFAPVALVVAVVALVGLTAAVASGSANPAVWTEDVFNTIHPTPPATPTSTPAADEAAPPAPTHGPEHSESPEPSERPEPSDRPEPRESPEPRDSPSGEQ